MNEGADRDVAGTSTRLALVLAGSFLLVLFLLFLMANQTESNPWTELDPAALRQAFGVTAAATAIGAGWLMIWWWRARLHGPALWLGLSLALVGVGILAISDQLGAVYGNEVVGGTLEALRTATVVVVVGMAIQGTRASRIDLAAGLGRAAAISTGAIAALTLVFSFADVGLTWSWPALWAGAAVATLSVGLIRREWMLGWFGVSMLALALYDLTMRFAPNDPILALGGGVILELGLIMVMVGTAGVVQNELALQSVRLLRAQAQVGRLNDDAKRTAHEARSAIAAIDHSFRLLTHSPEILETSSQLGDAVSAELKLLRRLVTPHDSRRRPFRVADALVGAATVERLYGVQIELDVDPALMALGDLAATAEAAQCLLENARIHAPGASVAVVATASGGMVEIAFADDGPGVASDQAKAIFATGVTTGHGQGLGLAIAADLMAGQGGGLRLDNCGERGACFIMTLLGASDGGDEIDEVGRRADRHDVESVSALHNGPSIRRSLIGDDDRDLG
ncbi:MAG: HAMP domain-containing histidine kinase [Acidimicrobiia bacterium]|nr:HAMP domain-containing histidine kinase [Acidimicrobiia bacterium]